MGLLQYWTHLSGSQSNYSYLTAQSVNQSYCLFVLQSHLFNCRHVKTCKSLFQLIILPVFQPGMEIEEESKSVDFLVTSTPQHRIMVAVSTQAYKNITLKKIKN